MSISVRLRLDLVTLGVVLLALPISMTPAEHLFPPPLRRWVGGWWWVESYINEFTVINSLFFFAAAAVVVVIVVAVGRKVAVGSEDIS